MHRKWIPLWRKSQDSAVFKNDHLWKLWTWCLMRMAFEPTTVAMKTGRGDTMVDLEPGQLIVGRKSGSEAMGWTGSNYRNRLKKLKTMGKVTIQTDTHWSIITVVNWDVYRLKQKEKDSEVDTQVDTQRTPKGQASGHKEEGLELKKVKKESIPPHIDDVKAHCETKGYNFDPDKFWHHHNTAGWKLRTGKKMVSWKSALVTWAKNDLKFNGPSGQPRNNL